MFVDTVPIRPIILKSSVEAQVTIWIGFARSGLFVFPFIVVTPSLVVKLKPVTYLGE